MPVVAGFFVGGGGVGLAVGALVVLVIVVVAVRQQPLGPIGSERPQEGERHVLIVAAAAVEDPADVSRVTDAASLDRTGDGTDVLVLVPARIGFLDRWASDLEGARHRAQQQLVVTVAALAKAGIAAEARVGDEDVVQAVEDQLQSYPATEVVLAVPAGDEHAGEVAAELRGRLRAGFREVRIDSDGGPAAGG